MMKVLTCTIPKQFNYQIKERPQVMPGNSIVKVKRIGVCGTDIHAYEGTQPYFNYPRVLGHELGCEFIEGDAEGFIPGEQITIIPYYNCGVCIACRSAKPNCCQNINVAGVHVDGGMAEYISVPSYSLVHGRGLSLDALALVEPLSVSAHGIRRVEIKTGEFVIVIGAGPIGLAAMEFASIAGGHVIAVDVNDVRLSFCKQVLNVPHALNALAPDLHDKISEITNGDMPTVVIDATGSLQAINSSFQFMAHTARYILIGLQKGTINVVHPEFHKREGTLMSSRNATRNDFDYVIDCIEKGLIDPLKYISHRMEFYEVMDKFDELFKSAGVIKAMINFDK